MAWNRFYVLHTKMRTDDDVDFETKECYTEASARNQYNLWKAEAYTNTTYPYIAVALLDCNMTPMEHYKVKTSYVNPVAEETTEETNAAEATG